MTAALSSSVELTTPLGEVTFDFCDTSNVLFGVSAIHLREPVLFTFTPVGDGAVDEG